VNPNDRAILQVYVAQFAARTDAYVRDSRVHVPEPLDEQVVAASFTEGFSVSGYMALKPERGVADTTHVAAIDFDTDDGMEQARAVRAFLAARAIPSLLVGSRRGAHLWLTFDPLPGSVVRRALKQALGLLGFDGPKAEVFPKQSGAPWGVGALRMPLMRHPKTGVRYPAYGPGDEVIERLSECLLAFDAARVEDLKALAGRADFSAIPSPATAFMVARASTGDEPRASALLATLGLHAYPNHSVRCPFHDDQHASLSIASDDMRVWCKSPECPAYNDGTGVGSIALEALLRKEPQRRVPPAADTHGVSDGVSPV
jgi:hypothetical protein